MTLLKLDHLAVSSTKLADGTAHVEGILGTSLSAIGEHPDMGTHNRLLSLGPDVYFEVIAINPEAKGPTRPRWFNIDNFNGPPRLTNWILQTPDMDAALEELPRGFGTPITLQRGDFHWKMAVPDTGILPWGGWAPAIIQWIGPNHPAPHLPDANIRLETLTLKHPDAEDIAKTLAPLMPRDTALFQVADTPELCASFDTPNGKATLI
jgi:hypothetical protein